jgi:dihydropteroate synthase
MGVINLTPDSFSDGGRFNTVERAVAQAGRQLAEGADVLDLGAQSTRPGADEVGAEEEQRRLLPVLTAIRQAYPDALVSVDTFLAAVAEAALEAGAHWVNDVSGGRRDAAMLPLIADAGCPYVLMHSRGTSKTMDALTDYSDVVKDVRHALQLDGDRAVASGVNPQQLIWDPGLGFAKTTAQNLDLLAQLETITSEGTPVLLGPSRKRFIGDVLHEPRARARLWGTAAVCCRAVAAGVAIVRVHDVGPIRQVVDMAAQLWPSR